MLSVIQLLGSEITFLTDMLALADTVASNRIDDDNLNMPLVTSLRERLSAVCYQAMQTAASSEADLVVKAKIVLSWVSSDGDWVHEFAEFLSQDVLQVVKLDPPDAKGGP